MSEGFSPGAISLSKFACQYHFFRGFPGVLAPSRLTELRAKKSGWTRAETIFLKTTLRVWGRILNWLMRGQECSGVNE